MIKSLPVGIFPQDRDKYEKNIDLSQKTFRCLNNKQMINLSQVNDDFVDCKDGSDEPGTSVMNYGYFYCQNIGFFPKNISRWSVGDGICDCCDGSDEWNNRNSHCPNKCLDLRNKYDDSIKKLHNHYEKGVAIKFKSNIEIENDILVLKWQKSILVTPISNNRTLYHEGISRIISVSIDQRTKFRKKMIKHITSTVEMLEKKKTELQNAINSGIKSIQQDTITVKYHDFVLEWPKEIRQGNKVIGRFDRVEGNQAHFTRGEHHWRVGMRQAIVRLQCWDSNKFLSIIEYDECRYRAVFASPLGCTNTSLSELGSLEPEKLWELEEQFK